MADEEQPGTALALTPVQQAAVKEVSSLAKLFHMEASGDVLADVLIQTAFSGDKEPTPAQLVALVVVAKQYRLNPFTKEIYAYPDKKKGIVPIVGVDGWIRIINEQPMLDGIEFNYSPEMVTLADAGDKQGHEWIECIITRKDRDKPIVIREYLDEVYKKRGTYDSPWQTHPKRFHRHKTLIQCARVAFGFAGIYDQDEADNIIQELEAERPQQRSGPARPKAKAKADPATSGAPQKQEAQREPERQQTGDPGPGDERREDIVDAEFTAVDEQEAQTDERANAADEQRAEVTSGGEDSTAGQGEAVVDDDWTPKPGEASEGTLEFIRRKGEQKGYDAIAICQQFSLNALRGTSEEKAAEILSWLKSAPVKEAQPA